MGPLVPAKIPSTRYIIDMRKSHGRYIAALTGAVCFLISSQGSWANEVPRRIPRLAMSLGEPEGISLDLCREHVQASVLIELKRTFLVGLSQTLDHLDRFVDETDAYPERGRDALLHLAAIEAEFESTPRTAHIYSMEKDIVASAKKIPKRLQTLALLTRDNFPGALRQAQRLMELTRIDGMSGLIDSKTKGQLQEYLDAAAVAKADRDAFDGSDKSRF